MQLKTGQRLRSAWGAPEFVVVRAAAGERDLRCGGLPLQALESDVAVLAAQPSHGVVGIGKRYFDEVSGVELLCTKGGAGELALDGRPVPLKQTKPLPASD